MILYHYTVIIHCAIIGNNYANYTHVSYNYTSYIDAASEGGTVLPET